jgi:hypothetical protein
LAVAISFTYLLPSQCLYHLIQDLLSEILIQRRIEVCTVHLSLSGLSQSPGAQAHFTSILLCASIVSFLYTLIVCCSLPATIDPNPETPCRCVARSRYRWTRL